MAALSLATAKLKGKTYEQIYGVEGAAALKEKRRQQLLGRKLSKETRDRISASTQGRPSWWKGKKRPYKARPWMRLKRGPLNPFWQGGKTPEALKIRTSREYILWRKAVFERDDYTCRFCKKRGGPLNADHIKPFATHPELRLKLSNGRTLCVPCHRKTPTFAGRTQPPDSHC